MFELYCNFYQYGSWKLELCERFTDFESVLNQTIAMWPENDRPVTMFIAKEGEMVTTFTPLGKKGENVLVIDNVSDTTYRCTDFVYSYTGDKITATKFRKAGQMTSISHESF